MAREYIVAGNWKMNGSRDDNEALVRAITLDARKYPAVEIVVCPPAPYLESVHQAIKSSTLRLGAQNLSEQQKPGAYTGEIHGAMLKEVGCAYVIVGHSERRALYGEHDELVARKFQTALLHGLTPILCVGETLQQREQGETEAVLSRQLMAVVQLCGIQAFRKAVLAYEPVWAIGTGKTASPQQAQEAHRHLRSLLAAADAKIGSSVRILYGGSVKADNAQALFAGPDVDGGLIGGAALKSAEFLAICAAAQAHSETPNE